jgi:hypothetical protein
VDLDWQTNYSLLHDIGVEHALLLQIIRDGILRQKWRLEPDFGSDPFAFGVERFDWVMAAPAAAELRAKVGALDLIKLLDLSPGFVADSAGNVNF